MKQLVKTLLAMLLIAMCLTSDTAQYASQFQGSRFKVQVSEPLLSANSAASAVTGPKPPSWENQKWIPLQVTLPCTYPLP